MASALNKRQQARNERTLQDLIKTVPGNDTCADCGARNPGWASWSLGIFLCMRCAALHRKLGTHISKVKSLSMDKWDNAQVDNMKRIGNKISNLTFNPRNIKPQIPIDIDEVDSALERYIRQKYEQRSFMNDSRPGTRQNTGSTSSVEDKPPPLPPKPSRRFGFGLQKTAALPRNVTPPISPSNGGFGDTSPPRVNKPSRIFGSHINQSGDGLESKLATLRDMGFPDEKRNATVLKGLNGNLDRAVEALIRLGEQNPGITGNTAPPPPAKSGVNGITINRTRPAPVTTPPTTTSMNPFDALDAVAPIAPPVSQQPQQMSLQTQQLPMNSGSYSQATSPANPYNPFWTQAQAQQFQQTQPQQFQQQQSIQQNAAYQQQAQYQQQNLEQSFQNLPLSNQQQPQQQQPLFPNRTGGYHQAPQFQQTNPFQHSFTPPPIPQQGNQYPFHITQPQYQQPQTQTQYQTAPSPTSAGNPFLRSPRSQMFPQQQQAMNPFAFGSQTPPATQTSNPWNTQPPAQTSQTGYPFPQHQNQLHSNINKNSILALYNYPQLAPQRPAEQFSPPPAAIPEAGPAPPAAGSLNPFAASQNTRQGQNGAGQQQASALPPAMQNQVQSSRHISNESVDFAGLMGGRHSPDAFSGLSAFSGR